VPIFDAVARAQLKAQSEARQAAAPALRKRATLPPAASHPALRRHALITREDRLEWLRAVVNGEVFETTLKRDRDSGEWVEISTPANLALRQKCVELLAKIEGDLIERVEVTEQTTGLLLARPDNGRCEVLPPGTRFVHALPAQGTPESEIVLVTDGTD